MNLIKIKGMRCFYAFLLLMIAPLWAFAQIDDSTDVAVPNAIKNLIEKCEGEPECYRDVAKALEPTLALLPDDKNPLVFRRSPQFKFYESLRAANTKEALSYIDDISGESLRNFFCSLGYGSTRADADPDFVAAGFTLLSRIDLPKGDMSNAISALPEDKREPRHWDCRYGFDNIAEDLKPTETFETAVLPMAQAFENVSRNPIWWNPPSPDDAAKGLDGLATYFSKFDAGLSRETIENSSWYQWTLAYDLNLYMCPAIDKIITVSVENYAIGENAEVDKALKIIEGAFAETGACMSRLEGGERAARYMEHGRPKLAATVIENAPAMFGLKGKSDLAFYLRLETYSSLFRNRQTIPDNYRSKFTKDMRRAQRIADSILNADKTAASANKYDIRQEKLVGDVLFLAGGLNLVADPERAQALGKRFNRKMSDMFKRDTKRTPPSPPSQESGETWQDYYSRIKSGRRSSALRAILTEAEDENLLTANPLNKRLLTDEAFLTEIARKSIFYDVSRLVVAIARAEDPAMAERLQSVARPSRVGDYKPNLAIAAAWGRKGNIDARNRNLKIAAQNLLKSSPGGSYKTFTQKAIELGAEDWLISDVNPLLEWTSVSRSKAPTQQGKWGFLSALFETGDRRLMRVAARDVAAYLPTLNKIESTRKTLFDAMLPYCDEDWIAAANQAYIDVLARQENLIFPAGDAEKIYVAGCMAFLENYVETIPMEPSSLMILRDPAIKNQDWPRVTGLLNNVDDPARLYGYLETTADDIDAALKK